MKKHVLYWFLLAGLIMAGCQKELSTELGNSPGAGTLQAEASGDCLPKTVNGVYEAGKLLVAATNTITVSVDVTKTGNYLITTDTVNGYFFRATGTFTALGMTTVTLRGNGTPFAVGTNNFVVSYDGDVCDIQVTVLPSGAGSPAVFTITSSGTPASCSGATPAGSYIIGTPLTSTNKVTLTVNVTTIGTYNVTTTAVNGMTFSGIGVFSTTGPQPLVLTGTGTPTGTAGPVTISVTAGTSTCSFQVTTTAGASYTVDCTSASVTGTFQSGVALTTQSIDVDVNVTAVGPYTITGTINGMTFTNSGTFATTGVTTVTLTGTGTPTAAGSFNLPVGTPPCNIALTVTGAPTIDWKFTEGATTYQGGSFSAELDVTNPPLANLIYEGDNAANDYIYIDIIDIAGGITNGELYKATPTGPENFIFSFYFENGAGTVTYEADFTNGTGLIITVTSHNTTTKTVTGTFSGTVKDQAAATKTITNGTFTIRY